MRIKRIVRGVTSVLLVAVGLTLLAFYFINPSPENTATKSGDPEGFNVPEVNPTQGDAQEVGGPADKTLKITVPKMNQIEDDTVPDTAGDDEQALKANGAIHLRGTGFPWQNGANVYLAGHRLGYPNTDSFLAFWDLNKLKKGDKAFVTDSEGTKYTYKVSKSFIVGPEELSVTKPIPGKNILTLQTCTLPDYSKRLIVQAELVDKQT